MGMFDQLKDLNEMRKQAKQMQLMLAQEEVEGKSAGGKITIVVDGNQEPKNVIVDDSIVGDRGEIARNIKEALSDVSKKHKKMLQKKFGGMMGQ
ncbi:MAG: YbaB/EbfC family nucleoid-associated protein [Candidatus Doudnabacteria bacterium]